MPDNQEEKTFYSDRKDDLYGNKLNPIAVPERNIGIDTTGEFYDNIVEAAEVSKLDIGTIESFSQISQDRNLVYNVLDTMAEDTTIAAVLETYAEDATQRNGFGKIMWSESSDAKVNKYITYLLDTLNVDKHIYDWVYSLCKYGDLYLRLFKKSDFDSLLAINQSEDGEQSVYDKKSLNEDFMAAQSAINESSDLNESVNIKLYSKDDKFAHYIEMVPNPAEMFELTKFGKTYAYIEAPTAVATTRKQDRLFTTSTYNYSFKKNDVNLYGATNFVHAMMKDNASRTPEQVSLFLGDTESEKPLTFSVNRGQSILYSSFKSWRNLMLLENSLLLNRLSKSAIVRIINVEVGDMPKESVGPHLQKIKNLIEQKTAIAQDQSLTEYTNPGPIENNIYVPTHGGIGTLSATEVGGDVNPGTLTDIDFFNNRLFGGLKVPKQIFGFTGDDAGFSGGKSLSLLSSRYAKTIERIQNTIIQSITDAINLLLLDKGLPAYINKFELHMVPPTTQEQLDRKDAKASDISLARDVMDLLTDVEDPAVRLKITKALLANVVENNEISELLEEEIEKLAETGSVEDEDEFDDFDDLGPSSAPLSTNDDFSLDNGPVDLGSEQAETEAQPATETETQPAAETVGELPSPSELGLDFTQNTEI